MMAMTQVFQPLLKNWNLQDHGAAHRIAYHETCCGVRWILDVFWFVGLGLIWVYLGLGEERGDRTMPEGLPGTTPCR